MKIETHKEVTHEISLSQEDLKKLLSMLDAWVEQTHLLPTPNLDDASFYSELLAAYRTGQGTALGTPFKELIY